MFQLCFEVMLCVYVSHHAFDVYLITSLTLNIAEDHNNHITQSLKPWHSQMSLLCCGYLHILVNVLLAECDIKMAIMLKIQHGEMK